MVRHKAVRRFVGSILRAEARRCFTDVDKKVTWLNKSGYSTVYQRGLVLIEGARKKKSVTDEKLAREKFAKDELTGRQLVTTMLDELKIKPGDATALRRAIADYDPARGPKPLSTFLYDKRNFEGDWRYLRHGIQIPKLSWLKFNDKASSAYVNGETVILFRHSWFRGSRAWIFGYPFRQENDLSTKGMHNAASSLISF